MKRDGNRLSVCGSMDVCMCLCLSVGLSECVFVCLFCAHPHYMNYITGHLIPFYIKSASHWLIMRLSFCVSVSVVIPRVGACIHQLIMV